MVLALLEEDPIGPRPFINRIAITDLHCASHKNNKVN